MSHHSAPPALAAWSATCDELLHGLAHALGNRLFALGAVHGALAEEATADPDLVGALGEEVARTGVLLRAMRLLAPDRRPPEPLDPVAMLADAETLVGFHEMLREVPCPRRIEGELPPVLARRGPLGRLLLLVEVLARRAAPGAAALHCSADDERVRIEVRADLPCIEGLAGLAEAARALAAEIDGELVEGNGGWTLLLPTLAAGRRRERERDSVSGAAG